MPVTEAQKRATAKYEKENYDKVLVRFPKGTKERIQNAGAESVNGYIIQCVLNSLETPQKAETEPITAPAEEVPQEQTEEPKKAYKEPPKQENKQFDEEANRKKLDDLQKLIDQKRAEQAKQAAELQAQKEERERLETEAKTAEIMQYVENIRKGEQMPEDTEKERMRQESIIKAGLPY